MANGPFVRLVVKADKFCLIALDGERELKRIVASSGTQRTGQARTLATLSYALWQINSTWRGKPTVVVVTVRDKNIMRMLRGEIKARKLAGLLKSVQVCTKSLVVHLVD